MATYNMKSPFDVFQFLPEGHEKALKQAFYNTGAMLFILIVFFMAVAVYHVMLPFMRPLLWALLCGSAIHPFHCKLSAVFRTWLNNMSASGTPLLVGGVMIPFSIFDSTAERLATFALDYWKKLLLFGIGLTTVYFGYNFLPVSVLSFLFNFLYEVATVLTAVLNISSAGFYITWSLVLAFIIMIWFWWNPESSFTLSCISTFLWMAVVCTVVSSTGPLALPILVAFVVLVMLGFFLEIDFKEWFTRHDEDKAALSDEGSESKYEDEQDNGFFQSVKNGIESIFFDSSPKTEDKCMVDGLKTPVESDQEVDAGEKLNSVPPIVNQTQVPKKPASVPNQKRTRRRMLRPARLSNVYLSGVTWACVLAELWQRIWLLQLLFIPVLYIVIKRLGYHFGLFELISYWLSNTIGAWFEARREVLFPIPLRGAWKILTIADTKIKQVLEKSVGTFTSIGLILLLFVGAVLGTIFMSIQVYGESVHLVEVTGNVINRTLTLPDNFENIDAMLDSMIGDAYLYGRQWISRSVQHFIDEKNEDRAAKAEKQMLQLWDEAYRLWISRNINSSVSDRSSQQMPSWKNLVDGVKHLDMDLLVNFVKENIGTFMSVVESLWAVLKGNITLALHLLTSSFSLAFGGGSAVLNFLLSFVIFSTALFYLLCASGQEYKPSELLSKLVPQSDAGTKFADAVEEAVYGVFAASFKMAAFYGLYTWFIHTLFEVRIIYIPSVLAALFGAVPFLGAYWACLPAVLELWLQHGQGFKALLMLGCQFLPAFFVDSTIYSEIKGAGHPYLTGLAIAGGVFYLGVEGALFGPLLLCFLFVVMNVYTNMMQGPTTAANSWRTGRYGFRRMLTVE